MEIEKWRDKNFRSKNYSHFDERININDSFFNYIKDPEKIKKHSFFPLIYKEQIFLKYDKNEIGNFKRKVRPLAYSSHKDRAIFSYYSFLLNKAYNDYCKKKGIDNSSIAYRTNLKKSNIDFAKEAFDFIKKLESGYIIIGDFKSFFDNLQHEVLKKNLCEVLKQNKLNEDWYAIYKNITKYSKCDIKELLLINGLNESEIEKLNDMPRVVTLEQFNELRKNGKIQNNKEKKESPEESSKGIPQGTPISAVFSNVYMINFDQELKEYVKQKNGLYLRYSDDFIIVIPDNKINIDEIKKYIYNLCSGEEKLTLEPNKTREYKYIKNKISEISSGKQIRIDYLGFTFDGEKIRIRDKTLTKYYYRMYKKIKTIKNARKKNEKVSCQNLYRHYSIKGIKDKKKNFISYVIKAEKIFENLEDEIKKVRLTHLKKIKNRLKIKI